MKDQPEQSVADFVASQYGEMRKLVSKAEELEATVKMLMRELASRRPEGVVDRRLEDALSSARASLARCQQEDE